MVGRFDVNVDGATSLSHQWRHYEGDYRQGPSVTILPGGVVTHGDQRLLKIPLDQWVRFEIRCHLGNQAAGEFQLRVWLPEEQSPRIFKDLTHDKRFTRLDWLGFVTRAEREAVCFVDSIDVRSVP